MLHREGLRPWPFPYFGVGCSGAALIERGDEASLDFHIPPLCSKGARLSPSSSVAKVEMAIFYTARPKAFTTGHFLDHFESILTRLPHRILPIEVQSDGLSQGDNSPLGGVAFFKCQSH